MADPKPERSTSLAPVARRSSDREERRRQWAHVRAILRPHRGRVALMAAASFSAGVTEAALLVVITRVGLAVADGKDNFGVLAGRSMSVSLALAAAGVLVVARLLLALLAMRATVSLSTRVGVAARRDVADAYLHTSWATQQGESPGRLQELILGFAWSKVTVTSAFGNMLNAGLSLTALIIGSVLINPTATLVVLIAVLALGAVLAPIRRAIRARSREVATAQMEFAGSVSELGALGMEMQAFGVRNAFSKRIDHLITHHAGRTARASIAQGMLTPLYTALAFAAIVGGLWLASVFETGELGGVAAVMLVMLRSLSYGQALQSASGSFASAAASLEVVDDTVRHYREHPAELGTQQIDRVGAIVADHVSFGYLDDRPVLHDLSFRIEPGEVIGVVGPSGAGKSTLVQLLLGLRNPDSGEISVGEGCDLRDVDRSSWSTLCAFVAQDANLISGSAADNIVFFRDHITPDRIEAAARDANVLAEITAMPDGFDTDIGERGKALSGGQRQRISIARALAGEPELLILDEPTSALDVRSEQLIRQTITALKGRVTVVIIAHRLSTLDMCDKIMVIEDGSLRAMAPAADLSRDNEFFRHSLEMSGMRP
jgi:ABC-type multidrug transport system fused ATPase/permease subunit